MPEKDVRKQLLRNILPPSNPYRSSQTKYGSAHPPKNTSRNMKNKSITPEASDKVSPPTTSAQPAKDEYIM